MQKLVHGLHHFQQHVFGSQRAFFERLADGQAPETLFITCSDSRINPNLMTQTNPGELFILRNAGNIVPPHSHDPNGEAATIEFAVEALGITDIVICGHSQCGAMKALVDPSPLADMPILAAWLANCEAVRRIAKSRYAQNVLVQIEHLRTQPAVAAALARGKLRLHAWVYTLETGTVYAYDSEQGQYAPIVGKQLPVLQQAHAPRTPWI